MSDDRVYNMTSKPYFSEHQYMILEKPYIHTNLVNQVLVTKRSAPLCWLIEHGISAEYARFARTHGQWERSTDIEDLLVALADKLWKGTRNRELEKKVVQYSSTVCREATWSVYTKLDDVLTPIADGSPQRLEWYADQPL